MLAQPIRVNGTVVWVMLDLCSQICLPFPASKQATHFCVVMPCPVLPITYTFPFNTTGVERPIKSVFQAWFWPSRVQVDTSPVSDDVPLCCGPRQCVQSPACVVLPCGDKPQDYLNTIFVFIDYPVILSGNRIEMLIIH